jgi:catechol 2,3-dioxygenase-like lactoylglutathione lyase family enzyme
VPGPSTSAPTATAGTEWGPGNPRGRRVLCDAGEVLASALTVAFVPSTDLDRSRRFYEGVLGLPVVEQDRFAVVLDAGRLTIRVTYVGPEFTVQPFTVLGWEVGDLQADMVGLVERGVTFLQVGALEQDEAGVWTAPDGTHIAWLQDPDGNTLSLAQHTHPAT